MALSDDSLILLCACVAMSNQLDRKKFATDMRMAAEVLQRQVPEMVGNVEVVGGWAKLIEGLSASFAGELPDEVKSAVRLLN